MIIVKTFRKKKFTDFWGKPIDKYHKPFFFPQIYLEGMNKIAKVYTVQLSCRVLTWYKQEHVHFCYQCFVTKAVRCIMSDNVSVSVKIEKKKNRDSKKKETNHTITFRKKKIITKKSFTL